jgi:transcriptional regulator GlxA family with amidase domain
MAVGECDPFPLPALRGARALESVLAHIDAHLGRPLPLAVLAAMAGLSIWRFSIVFRQRLGLPPQRYIRVLRIKRAQVLLRQGMPAAIVAGEVGFCDQSHLARCFKRVCNMTPGQYQAGCRPPAGARMDPL